MPSPARTAVASIVQHVRSLRDEYGLALAVSGTGFKGGLCTDRFAVTRAVSGERLLILDDTFTSGATLFSAVAALLDGGAEIVGPVVLGRHVQPSWEPSRAMLSWLRTRSWVDERCCRCDGELANPGQLL